MIAIIMIINAHNCLDAISYQMMLINVIKRSVIIKNTTSWVLLITAHHNIVMYMAHHITYAMEMRWTSKPVSWMDWNAKLVNQFQMFAYVNRLKTFATTQIINALQFYAKVSRNPCVNKQLTDVIGV